MQPPTRESWAQTPMSREAPQPLPGPPPLPPPVRHQCGCDRARGEQPSATAPPGRSEAARRPRGHLRGPGGRPGEARLRGRTAQPRHGGAALKETGGEGPGGRRSGGAGPGVGRQPKAGGSGAGGTPRPARRGCRGGWGWSGRKCAPGFQQKEMPHGGINRKAEGATRQRGSSQCGQAGQEGLGNRFAVDRWGFDPPRTDQRSPCRADRPRGQQHNDGEADRPEQGLGGLGRAPGPTTEGGVAMGAAPSPLCGGGGGGPGEVKAAPRLTPTAKWRAWPLGRHGPSGGGGQMRGREGNTPK